MTLERMALLQWSEFIKLSKFAKIIGVSPQAVNSWLKYGTQSLNRQKQRLLYETILDYMKKNFA